MMTFLVPRPARQGKGAPAVVQSRVRDSVRATGSLFRMNGEGHRTTGVTTRFCRPYSLCCPFFIFRSWTRGWKEILCVVSGKGERRNGRMPKEGCRTVWVVRRTRFIVTHHYSIAVSHFDVGNHQIDDRPRVIVNGGRERAVISIGLDTRMSNLSVPVI